MVIRGRTRGNGRQLASYLLFLNENEDIRILDVAGRPEPQDIHLHDALYSMSLTSELSESDKGLYHAQINPAYGDDARMTPETWLQAADMLGSELGLAGQRRIVVLHSKKGRTHAHVVWERFDLENNRMITDSFSRLAQDRARKEMERVFEQQPTPHRNVKRPEMKTALSALWEKTKSGFDFLKECGKSGYIIAKGVQRRPFMVIDDTGRSFDLVRQLDGVKTKDVRERLKTEKLPPEKEAILSARSQASTRHFDDIQEQAIDKMETFAQQRNLEKEAKKFNIAQEFAQTRQNIVTPATGDLINEKERQEKMAREFSGNGEEVILPQSEKDRKRQEMLDQLKAQAKDPERNKDKEMERD